MPKIKLNDLDYGGSPTVEDADHLMVADTRNQTLSAQNIITNILGDVAQLEHNATASKAYAKGEYLVLGSYFYKATAAIAQGDTLVAGTNIEQTNVGAEMRENKSKIVILYSYDKKSSGTLKLTDDYTNYDLLIFLTRTNADYYYDIAPVEIFSDTNLSQNRVYMSHSSSPTVGGFIYNSILRIDAVSNSTDSFSLSEDHNDGNWTLGVCMVFGIKL